MCVAAPERLLAVVLTQCRGVRFSMLDLSYTTAHFAGDRSNSSRSSSGSESRGFRSGPGASHSAILDLSVEESRMRELANGRGHCRYCLRAQAQAAKDWTSKVLPETSLELSGEGVRITWGGGRGATGAMWTCRTRATGPLRFNCTSSATSVVPTARQHTSAREAAPAASCCVRGSNVH